MRMRMKNVVFASDRDNETPSSSDANSVGSLSLSLPLCLGSREIVECMDGLGFETSMLRKEKQRKE